MGNRQLVLNSAYYTVGEIFPRIIGFFLLPVLTRYLSPAQYGINNYTNTVMLLSFALSSLSLNTFLLRNYYKEESPEGKKKLIGNVFLLMLLTNALLTGLELLLFPWALERLNIQIPFRPFFLLAILNNFLEGIAIVPLILYRVRKNAKAFVLANASKTFFQFAVTVFMLTRLHEGLTGVYLARLYVNIPYTLVFLYIIYRNAIFRPDRRQFRQGLAFSLPLLPGAISYLLILSFDRVVLEKNIGLAMLGIYASAATLALTLNIIVQGLYRTFEQKIFEKHGAAGYPEVKDTLYRYFITCLMTGGFLLSVFSREVFLLFTSAKFLSAYTLVPLLTVPVILSGLSTFLGTLLVADHKQKVITVSTVLSLVITIAGNLVLIRIIGVYGAIITSTVSFSAVFYFYLRNVSLKHHFVIQILFLLALLLPAGFLLQDIHIPIGWSMLLKAVLSLLYFRLCVFLFDVKLNHIEL